MLKRKRCTALSKFQFKLLELDAIELISSGWCPPKSPDDIVSVCCICRSICAIPGETQEQALLIKRFSRSSNWFDDGRSAHCQIIILSSARAINSATNRCEKLASCCVLSKIIIMSMENISLQNIFFFHHSIFHCLIFSMPGFTAQAEVSAELL